MKSRLVAIVLVASSGVVATGQTQNPSGRGASTSLLSPTGQPGDDPCRFSITPLAAPIDIVGPSTIASRTHVLIQPDSPVAITRVDLNQLLITADANTFQRSGVLALELTNLSDEAVTTVIVGFTTTANSPVADNMLTSTSSLAPHNGLRIEGNVGQASGPAPGGHFAMMLWVDAVQKAGCVYKPSQAWRAIPQ
jgi:hypothetical protein